MVIGQDVKLDDDQGKANVQRSLFEEWKHMLYAETPQSHLGVGSSIEDGDIVDMRRSSRRWLVGQCPRGRFDDTTEFGDQKIQDQLIFFDLIRLDREKLVCVWYGSGIMDRSVSQIWILDSSRCGDGVVICYCYGRSVRYAMICQ